MSRDSGSACVRSAAQRKMERFEALILLWVFFDVRKMIKEALQNVSFSRGRIRKLCNSETRVGFRWELLFFLRELRMHERGSLAAQTHSTLDVF